MTDRTLSAFILILCAAGCDSSDGPDVKPDGGAQPDALTDLGTSQLSPQQEAAMRLHSPLPALPADTTNRYADDPRAAALGQMLFFEKAYSGALAVDGSDLGTKGQPGRISCASCHLGQGQDDQRSRPNTVSQGADWLTRNSLTLVNASFYRWTNWAGRFAAQWELPIAVAENARNMNSDRLKVVHTIFGKYKAEYEAVFGALEPAIGTDMARFPGSAKPKAAGAADGAWEAMSDGDRAVANRAFVNYAKALAAYMRTLVSRDTRFDRFVAGDTSALDAQEIAGMKVFLDKGNCTACHKGPHFTDNAFHNLGLPQTGDKVPGMDLGRFADVPPLLASSFNVDGAWSDDRTTRKLDGLVNPPDELDKGKFRTPSLRQVALTAPYMHAGQLATLEEVVGYYDRGGSEPTVGQKDTAIKPLGLAPEEKAALVAFLKTLTASPLSVSLLNDTSKP